MTNTDPGFEENLKREVSEIRRHTIPIEVSKVLLAEARVQLEQSAAANKALELEVSRLRREMVALDGLRKTSLADMEVLKAQLQEIQEDELTGLLSRRLFKQMCNHDLAQARRMASLKAPGTTKLLSGATLLMFDIDHFKNVNDTYGHPTGDLVLSDIAKVLKHGYREIDIIGRWGGEEFLVYLPWCPVRGAVARTLEILRDTVARLVFGPEGSNFSVTMTVGVSQLLDPEDTLETLVDRADQALYHGKQYGRNQIVVWSGPGHFSVLKTTADLDTTPLP